MEAAPARWSENIAISTAGPTDPEVESGAYTVQPVPAPKPVPPGTKLEPKSIMKPTTVSQNEMLFIRGNAMSGAPIIRGTNQLPKPPIKAGITMKNTMIRPWAVISTFHI